ncbi:glycoside hydrolase family 95-like protein [Pedobacter alluvionis]
MSDAWKAFGEIKELKARGDFTVDMNWKEGKNISCKITSAITQQ